MIARYLFVALICVAFHQEANAKAKIPFGNREVITKVADLPKTEEYRKDGEQLNLATIHEEFNIAWILPLYISKEPRLVAIGNSTDTYYDLPDETLHRILQDNKLDKEKLLKLGFYTRYGGKIMASLLLLFIIWGMIPEKKKKVKPVTV